MASTFLCPVICPVLVWQCACPDRGGGWRHAGGAGRAEGGHPAPEAARGGETTAGSPGEGRGLCGREAREGELGFFFLHYTWRTIIKWIVGHKSWLIIGLRLFVSGLWGAEGDRSGRRWGQSQEDRSWPVCLSLLRCRADPPRSSPEAGGWESLWPGMYFWLGARAALGSVWDSHMLTSVIPVPAERCSWSPLCWCWMSPPTT